MQYSYFASHQFFIADMGNEMSENRAAAKEAIRVLHSKSPVAHTNHLFRKMNRLRVSDLFLVERFLLKNQ